MHPALDEEQVGPGERLIVEGRDALGDGEGAKRAAKMQRGLGEICVLFQMNEREPNMVAVICDVGWLNSWPAFFP